MNIKQEKEHSWIIGICSSEGDSVDTYKVIGTESMVKSHLLGSIIEDKNDNYEYGTETLDEIEVRSNSLYGFNCFADHHIDYEAVIDEDEPKILDYEYRELPQSYKDYIEKDKNLYNDVILSICMGNSITFYDNIAALGEDNSDNGCREDDDTDESFGQFLIDAYKSGNSNVIYAEMPDKKVLSLVRVE